MQEVVMRSTSHMSDGDLTAIATCLTALPALPGHAVAEPEARAMQAGETVFVQSCAICHAPADAGQPPDYPKLSNNPLVNGSDPATVLRIILQGAQSAATANAHTGYSMPAFVALSDEEIANVATYIRNAWGNRASAVRREDVRSLRATLGARQN
jgi:mono/diheme cytochrome c family protein